MRATPADAQPVTVVGGVLTVRILGPIEVKSGDTTIAVGARGRRAVLALLALTPGRVVSMGAIVEAIWGDDPPASAENLVQGYVSKLRGLLGAGSIVTHSPGYRLEGVEVDAVTFTDLVERAHGANAADAAAVLEEALGLWRGELLADLDDLDPVRAAVPRWTEARLSAQEALARVQLALGRHDDALARLEELTREHAYREEAHALYVDALRAGGRRTEALRAAQRAREVLADAGLDAGSALVDAERRALDESAVALPAVPAAPRPVSSFVGRSADVEVVGQMIEDAALVTLVGPGGTGKTRLALQVAGSAAAFVDLARIRDGRDVQRAAGTALGVAEGNDDTEVALRRWVARQSDQLVIVDNCEHVLDGAAGLVDLLTSAGSGAVRVLATSRERLGVDGERVWPVPPLDPGDAAELFVTRLRALDPKADPAPDLVAAMVEGLDRLPLAIELAAARAASLGADEVRERLGDRLRLLASTRRAGARQGSLRAVIEWSHELLDDDERMLFRRLSVFAGPFSLREVEAVCGGAPLDPADLGDITARLVDKSLIRRDGRRLRLLETIRDYARERLDESGEAEAVADKHTDWALGIGDDPKSADARRADDDLRAALDRCAATQDPRGFTLGMRAAAVSEALGRGSEAQSRASVAASLAGNPADRARALTTVAEIAWSRWRGDEAIDALRECAPLFREAGDRAAAIAANAASVEIGTRFGATVARHPTEAERAAALAEGLAAGDEIPAGVRARVWTAQAFAHRVDGVPSAEAARRALQLARRDGDPLTLSAALDAMEASEIDEGHFGAAIRFVVERLALLDRLPAGRLGNLERSDILVMATECFSRAGDFGRASIYAEALGRAESEQHAPGGGQERLVTTRFLTGEWDRCLDAGRVLVATWEINGRPPAGFLVDALACIAVIQSLRGDPAANTSWALCDELMCNHPSPYRAVFVATCRADLALVDGRPDEGVRILDEIALTGWFASMAASVKAEAAMRCGDPRTKALLAEAHALAAEDAYGQAILMRAEGNLTGAQAAFAALPCPYQEARTALERGGSYAEGAQTTLAALGVRRDGRAKANHRVVRG